MLRHWVGGEKKPASFQGKKPVIYRLSSKKHFKIPGNFEPILGHESVVSLWRKRHFLKKRSKRWRGFPPGGIIMMIMSLHCFYLPVLTKFYIYVWRITLHAEGREIAWKITKLLVPHILVCATRAS